MPKTGSLHGAKQSGTHLTARTALLLPAMVSAALTDGEQSPALLFMRRASRSVQTAPQHLVLQPPLPVFGLYLRPPHGEDNRKG